MAVEQHTLIDTHTHPHMAGYKLPPSEFWQLTEAAGVEQVICVGTDAADSQRAIEFTRQYRSARASVGLHPHEASRWEEQRSPLAELAASPEVVAIGECGLDYYYAHSTVAEQQVALQGQLELAYKHDLPLIFHVRRSSDQAAASDAFTDLFELIDEYADRAGRIRGVVHSFTAEPATLKACVDRGLYIGLNGIMTFTRDAPQLAAAKAVPLANLVLETDAPFLTPDPYRGTVNHSGHVRTVAEFLSQLRGEPLVDVASATTKNAKELFRL
ncbi:MAG: TatD family hydrolase [Candidatus Saccharimonadales bacterium]